MAQIPEVPSGEAPQGMAKFVVNTGTGAAFGAVYGSVISAWATPHARASDGVLLAEEALPSFSKMSRYVGGNAMIFAGVAAAFTVGESIMTSIRGESDIFSAMAGGLSGGFLLGTRATKISSAFGMAGSFALVSAMAHVAGDSVMQDKEKLYKRLSAIRS